MTTAPVACTSQLLESIDQICGARAGELQGLPDGCMPGSPCAVVHLYPYTALLLCIVGMTIGACLTHFFHTYAIHRRDQETP